jgi:sigma-B regulation protein RsbU (phosphoserine phosphatase)
MLFFKTKKPILNETRNEAQDNVDLQIINKMNQEFAISLDLKETLNTALQIIITRLNAQAANVFLINNKTKKFE